MGKCIKQMGNPPGCADRGFCSDNACGAGVNMENQVIVYGVFSPTTTPPFETQLPTTTASLELCTCSKVDHEKLVALRTLSETWKSVLKKDAKHAKALLEQIIKIIDG